MAVPISEWIEFIRLFTGGSNEETALCRDKRDSSLVVSKIFEHYETDQGLYEVELYRERLPQHPNVIRCVSEPIPDYPLKGCCTVLFEYANAGSLANLREYAEWKKTQIPEAFLWRIIHNVLEGLMACETEGICHGDLHSGNIFLHFPHVIEEQFPVAVIGDFGDAFEGYPLQLALRMDLIRFFSSLMYLINTPKIPKGSVGYSKALVDWISVIAGDTEHSPPEFAEVVRELYPRIPSFVRECKGDKTLPQWLVGYFTHLQANAEKNTVRRRETDATQGKIVIDLETEESQILEAQDTQAEAETLVGSCDDHMASNKTEDFTANDCPLAKKPRLAVSLYNSIEFIDDGSEGKLNADIEYVTGFTGDNQKRKRQPSPQSSCRGYNTASNPEAQPCGQQEEMLPPRYEADEQWPPLTTKPKGIRAPLAELRIGRSQHHSKAHTPDEVQFPDLALSTEDLISALELYFDLGSSCDYNAAIGRVSNLRNSTQTEIWRKKMILISSTVSKRFQLLSRERREQQENRKAGSFRTVLWHAEAIVECARRRRALEKAIAHVTSVM